VVYDCVQNLTALKLPPPETFDFLLDFPSDPGARGRFRGRPDPLFLVAADAVVASPPSCC